jgi:hypothetical protein
MKRIVAVALLALSACGPPAGTDVASEIMDASKGVIGKQITLKTSASLKSNSLADVSRLWSDLGWQKVSADVCKGIAPSDWENVEAFDFQGVIPEPKQDQSYNLRICATELASPKRIVAIGFVVSSQKTKPYKP